VRVPTVHRFGPWSANGVAAFWLNPVSLRDFQRYTPREIGRIRRIVVANRELLLRHWHDFFDPHT
jgi:hypothetical protein